MTGQSWRELERGKLECYSYRRTGFGAISKTLVYSATGKIYPVEERRSRSGRHGEDCYYSDTIDKAAVIVHVDISNSGKDRTVVYTKPGVAISPEVLETIIRDLEHYGVTEEIVASFRRMLEKQLEKQDQ